MTTGDPLDAEGPEVRVFRGYGAAYRAVARVTLDAVPASWPAFARVPLTSVAALVAVVLTAVAWVGVTIALAANLIARRSPSGR